MYPPPRRARQADVHERGKSTSMRRRRSRCELRRHPHDSPQPAVNPLPASSQPPPSLLSPSSHPSPAGPSARAAAPLLTCRAPPPQFLTGENERAKGLLLRAACEMRVLTRALGQAESEAAVVGAMRRAAGLNRSASDAVVNASSKKVFIPRCSR